MIKLFRKLKLSLPLERNIHKYLAYSIGQVLLVMIGILLALAVNNWNERRKLDQAETQYYSNLKRQLEEDKRFIRSNIEFNDRYRQQYAYALKRLQAGDRSNLDTLGRIAVNMLEYSDFHQQRNIYGSLVSGGEIDAIQAGILAMELKEWYGSAALVGLNDLHQSIQKKGITDEN